MATRRKALGLTLVFGVPILLLFNWIVRRWPRRYWLGIWVVTLPILVLVIFIAPLLAPIFDKFEPLQKIMPRWWRSWRKWWRAPEPIFRPIACT